MQYQQSQRDIALVLDEATPVAELIDSIKAMQQQNFVGVNLFDVYAGENIETGQKSIALNLVYQSLEATMDDEQVNNKVDEVLDLLQSKFGAVQR
jgi:phenylalanyl-tRNA synthetase beta chain